MSRRWLRAFIALFALASFTGAITASAQFAKPFSESEEEDGEELDGKTLEEFALAATRRRAAQPPLPEVASVKRTRGARAHLTIQTVRRAPPRVVRPMRRPPTHEEPPNLSSVL